LEVGVNSYVSVEDATAYFADRFFAAPPSSVWEEADTTARETALTTATARIDRLTLVGVKADPDQDLEFPRSYVTTVEEEPKTYTEPEVLPNVKRAVYEEALAILGGDSPSLRAQLQAEGVTSARIGSVAETYDGSGALMGGFASGAAAEYMKPYMKSVAAFG
jgi:hypothetical protein